MVLHRSWSWKTSKSIETLRENGMKSHESEGQGDFWKRKRASREEGTLELVKNRQEVEEKERERREEEWGCRHRQPG